MASAELRDKGKCTLCLDKYSDPVELPCGDLFCRTCISGVLDTQKGCKAYTCPACKATYKERPALQTNKIPSIQTASLPSTQPEQDTTGIFCTYCTNSPVPAAKSCHLCEASLCDTHLAAHSKSPQHVLTEPTLTFLNKLCPIHKKPLELYCCNDVVCICESCCHVGGHKGHNIRTLKEASEKKKEKLQRLLEQVKPKVEAADKRLQREKDHRRDMEEKSDSDTKQVITLFRDMREQLDTLESNILLEISNHKEEVSRHHSKVIEKLETENNEVSNQIHHIEELCNIADPLNFLQQLKSEGMDSCDPEDDENERTVPIFLLSTYILVGTLLAMEALLSPRYVRSIVQEDTKMCSHGRLDEDLISGTLLTGLANIMANIKRKISWEKATDMLLDIDTAANNVSLSWSRKKLSFSSNNKGRPKTPQRFKLFQVLSRGSFSLGHHYWELAVSGSGCWRVGVAYNSIEKKGEKSYLGNNEKSWCLCRENNTYSVIHNSQQTNLHHKPLNTRIRITLDYEAGRLSFYELSDPLRHLHTFTASFTEPLHAAFYVDKSCSVKIIS
ncbi:E3 ubiquitin-protein ligase Midline-1 [Xenopus laevis]|uniref:Uncharacterized protein n=2 Tax=Xenopus laevis TaxID=8355 RepID=A0A974DKD0_XENLA|nr:E3 ubiquitin-protein ligase Midline-1 [Xenopus laevis]OCT93448.1 hypothetical protein XELAEV_18016517mg [Xenopus laevis]